VVTVSKITDQRYDETINVLENSFLTAAAYDVVTDGPNGAILKINVKDYDQFSIMLRQVTEGNVALAQAFNAQRRTYLVSIESPGDYIEDQRTEISDFSEFLRRLGLWCERVKKTLIRNDSLQRQLSNLREQFEKELANHVGDTGVHFTADEKEAIFSKIDELAIKTQEMLSTDAAKTEKIEKLQSMITEMKAATALPKKMAIRVIGYKFAAFVVSATSSALLADGINYAIGLLNR
jgi:hypothetical protein